MLGIGRWLKLTTPLLLVALVSTLSSAGETGEKIAISLKIDKSEYFVTEPVRLTIQITNNYDEVIWLALPGSFSYREPPASFSANRKGHGAVPLKRVQSSRKRRPVVGSATNNVFLKPGASATISTYLNAWVKLERAGAYEVSCDFRPEAAVTDIPTTTGQTRKLPSDFPSVSAGPVAFTLKQPTKKWLADREEALVGQKVTESSSRRAKREFVAALVFVDSARTWGALFSFLSENSDYASADFIERRLLTLDDADRACRLAAKLLGQKSETVKLRALDVIRLRGSKGHALSLQPALDDDSGMVRWIGLLAVNELLGVRDAEALALGSPPARNGPEIQRAKAALVEISSQDAATSSWMLWGVAALIVGLAIVVVVVLMVKRKRKLRGHGRGQESS